MERAHVVDRRYGARLALASIAAGIAVALAVMALWNAYAPPMPLSLLQPQIEQRTQRYDLVRLRFELQGREADCRLTVYHDSDSWTLHC